MNIVLHEPEIPQNTANIGRSCVCSGSRLHLIEPLGFSLDERAIRRAGLDYWKSLEFCVYKSFEDFLIKNKNPKIYMSSTKAQKRYDEAAFEKDCFIMFGKESAGIPEKILRDYSETAIRIPMRKGCRSLNLSSSVAITLFEALRQNNFDGLESAGCGF